MPTLIQLLRGAIAGLIFERPARKQSLAEIGQKLEQSAQTIDSRAVAAKNAKQTQIILRHITGMERWGQSRLRAFLGQPLQRDEYDGYRPATNLSTEQQRQEFRQTRAETLALARQIAEANLPSERRVLHNSLGELSAGAWLLYL